MKYCLKTLAVMLVTHGYTIIYSSPDTLLTGMKRITKTDNLAINILVTGNKIELHRQASRYQDLFTVKHSGVFYADVLALSALDSVLTNK